MHVYRISKTEYANDLSGYGASLYGGRWNPRGLHMLYTVSSTSLAILEYLAHNMQVFRQTKLTLSTLILPKPKSIQIFTPKDLPEGWNTPYHISEATQQIGADFLKNKTHHLLKVPSVIAPNEFNLLLHPAHDAHKQLEIVHQVQDFKIDQRLH